MSQENRSNLSFEIAANKERSPIYFNQEGKTGISKNSILRRYEQNTRMCYFKQKLIASINLTKLVLSKLFRFDWKYKNPWLLISYNVNFEVLFCCK